MLHQVVPALPSQPGTYLRQAEIVVGIGQGEGLD